MKTLVLIPAYNEEKNIEGVIKEVKKEMPESEILVVNDGSSDLTGSVSEKTGNATVVFLPYNLGIGGAVQAGFKYAESKGYEAVIRLDADGQHPASEINKVLDPILKGESDMVIGSRFLNVDRPHSIISRRIGQKIISFLLTVLLGKKITDPTSGFRGYNSLSLKVLNKYYPSDYPEPEEIVFLKKNRFTIKEVAVLMRQREAGTSSLTTIRSIYYAIKVILSIFISILRAPIIKK